MPELVIVGVLLVRLNRLCDLFQDVENGANEVVEDDESPRGSFSIEHAAFGVKELELLEQGALSTFAA